MERPYKILVVDDEPDLKPLVLQRMRRDIRDGRYEFVFAENGVEALAQLDQDEGIDMVLSDINMPQMDGLTLLEQMRQTVPNIRSVIVSAYGDMKNIRAAMNRGAFDFVTKPIDFEDLQVTIARTLSRLAEWRDAVASRDKLIALENELAVASKMQQAILPVHFPEDEKYRVFGQMMPARNVGGDFFDIIRLDNGRVGVCIADVSDKGVPAALFMMSSRTLLKGAAIGHADPGGVLREVNDLLYDDNETMMFVTLLYAVCDPGAGKLTYANGGHNPPLVIRENGESVLLPTTRGVALGIVPFFEYQQNSIATSPGDIFIFYTDGVTEAMNSDGEEFGMERLRQVFVDSPPTDCQTATEAVFQAVSAFAGGHPQSDDITCVALRPDGGG